MEITTYSHRVFFGVHVKSLVNFIILLLGVGHTASERVSYAGQSVIRAWPDHEGHISLLSALHQQNTQGVEFWRTPTRPEQSVDIRVARHVIQTLLDRFRRSNLRYEVTVEDLQRAIEDERLSRPFMHEDPASFNISIYHTYEEIMDWMEEKAKKCGPLCQTITIGYSFEGRPLKVMRLGTLQNEKPVIWIDAGLHAREWIAPATAIRLINRLLSSNPTNYVVRHLLNYFTWYILPIANPDGYVYTWNTDRLWRKTRSKRPGITCIGADPNRNWDFHWGGEGTSDDPCSENYRGIRPFSEPEPRAMSEFLSGVKDQLEIYLTLHSYGQYWLTPWGYTKELPEDYDDMEHMGNVSTAAMRARSGTYYRVGASARMLYLASGGSDDWVKGVLGTKYSYTVELRDTGKHGFVLPSNYIEQTGDEMFDAIREMATEYNRIKLKQYSQFFLKK